MKRTITSTLWLKLSAVNILLITFASLSGIFNPATYAHETANWAMQAVGQDIGNLLAVVVLLVSTFFITRKSFTAYFIWLGVHMYLIYAYLLYAFFVHFNFLFLIYVAILGISSYTLLGSLLEQDSSYLVKRLITKHIKFTSIVLILTGTLFTILWLSEIIPALLLNQPPKSAAAAGLWVNPVQVIDLSLVLPGITMTGILLWKRKAIGYLFAAPWLTFSVLMGASIIFTMVLEITIGTTNAVIPLIFVGVIVAASLSALVRYLKAGILNGVR
jgi:hypothetical protein